MIDSDDQRFLMKAKLMSADVCWDYNKNDHKGEDVCGWKVAKVQLTNCRQVVKTKKVEHV